MGWVGTIDASRIDPISARLRFVAGVYPRGGDAMRTKSKTFAEPWHDRDRVGVIG